jgi:hypothetical protein
MEFAGKGVNSQILKMDSQILANKDAPFGISFEVLG